MSADDYKVFPVVTEKVPMGVEGRKQGKGEYCCIDVLCTIEMKMG